MPKISLWFPLGLAILAYSFAVELGLNYSISNPAAWQAVMFEPWPLLLLVAGARCVLKGIDAHT